MVRVEKLKKELALLKLPTTGTKSELQQRIRAAMEEEIQKDKDQPNHGSEDGSVISSEILESNSDCSENKNMSQMLEAIQKIMLENSVQLLEMENKFQEYTQCQENLLTEQQLNLEEKLKKQQEITQSFHEKLQKLQKCIDNMQDRIQKLEEKETNNCNETYKNTENGERIALNKKNGIDAFYPSESLTEVENFKIKPCELKFKEQEVFEKIYEKLKELEKEIHESQVRASVAQCTKFQPPTFDGTTSFSLFHLQFETVIKANQWNDKDRLAALILALRAGALTVLQTLPQEETVNYETLMNALKRKYASEHMKHFYRIALKSRIQSCSETLQEHAMEVERLAHMAYDIETPKDLLEQCKIDAFINGILDPTIKYAALTNPKFTFTESIANAMTHETLAILARHSARLSADQEELTKTLCDAVEIAIQTQLQADISKHKA